jgi:O-antigen/teichoic acid export membrane protein
MISKFTLNPEKDHPVIAPKGKKQENLTQRAYLNSLSGIIDYAGIQLTGFFVSPYLVAGLGSAMFGVWQMLSQITGYAKLADTRATQVLKWNIAKKRDTASPEELRSDVTTALVVSIFILPFILIIGGIISWYVPYITKVEAAYVNLTRITCSLLILSLVISRIFDLFESTLGGMNLGYKRMGFRATIVVIGGALKVWVITQGYGLIALSLIQVLIALITGITFYFIVKKQVGWFGFGTTTKANIVAYSQLSGWLMAFTGSKMFLMSSDKIVLGYLIGTVFVTQYTLTMFTSVAIQGIILALISGITPGIGKLFGNQDFEKVKKVRKLINNLAWLFAVSTGVAVLLFNKSFIQLWIGPNQYAGLYENFFILLISIQSIFFQIDGFIINVTLDLKMKFILSAIAALVTLLLAFLLVEQYQIAGLCLSILAGRLVLTIGYPVILKKRMQDTSSLLSGGVLQPIVMAGFFLVLAAYVSQWISIANWFLLGAAGLIAFTGTALLFWAAGIRPADRAEVWATVSKIKLFKRS